MLAKPEVSVQLARTAGTAPVTGEYLVGPDGTINLRQYGTLHVAGKTITEIRMELNKHLSQYFDSPEASVDVRQFNSKVFYVITEGAGMGDNIRRVPITGNDTVLDALSAVNGLSQVSSATVWVARPAPGGFGCEQILPVDYEAITQGGVGGHELPDHAGRSGVHRRGQHDGVQQLADEGDGADRAVVGHRRRWAPRPPAAGKPSAANTTERGSSENQQQRIQWYDTLAMARASNGVFGNGPADGDPVDVVAV